MRNRHLAPALMYFLMQRKNGVAIALDEELVCLGAVFLARGVIAAGDSRVCVPFLSGRSLPSVSLGPKLRAAQKSGLPLTGGGRSREHAASACGPVNKFWGPLCPRPHMASLATSDQTPDNQSFPSDAGARCNRREAVPFPGSRTISGI